MKIDFDEERLRPYGKNYSENGLWDKIRKVFGKVGQGLVYCVLLLYYVLISPEVPLKYKTIIVGALGYFILPLDIIPDWLPVFGYTDDLAALYAALKAVLGSITPAIRARAREKLESWFDTIDESALHSVEDDIK